jgi:proteasome assembly chaperone (PAC2) family protein
MALHRRHPGRDPRHPVLVVHLEGWVDAGLGAGAAVGHLLEERPAEAVADFDADELIDYRARRPVLRLIDGVNEGLTWREPRLVLTTDREDNDVLVLVGPEPDMRWRAFVADVTELARSLDVRLMVGLGSFPAPVPHTRPVRVAATATDAATAARIGFVAGNIEVPAGIHAALELSLSEAGIPAVGLWARVPHYIAGYPYPAASAALLTTLASVAELSLDTSALETAGDAANRRVDELVARSAEHQEMVGKLEASVDDAEGTPLNLGEIPSGDEIAAELQRFLRDSG